jgi:glucose dehydrogenase
MFRGDAQHTGTCPDSKVPAGKVKWRFQTGNKIRSAPALYNGVAYFGSDDGHLYALDAQTGKLQWKFQAAGAVSSSPAVSAYLLGVFVAPQANEPRVPQMIVRRPFDKFKFSYQYRLQPVALGHLIGG